jgi:branched-chain amino acid transport system permease protein
MAPVKSGLMGGLIALLIAMVGLVEVSVKRPILTADGRILLSVGQLLLLLPIILMCYKAVQVFAAGCEKVTDRLGLLATGALSGFFASLVLAALVLLGRVINLRTVFIRASPDLFNTLTFGLGLGGGSVVLLLFGALLGGLVAAITLLPDRIRRPLVLGLALVPLAAILTSALFAGRGFSVPVALLVGVVAAALTFAWRQTQPKLQDRVAALSPSGQRTYQVFRWLLPVAIVLALPRLGAYPSEVLVNVGLFVLMGLGLNIVVGFAGLLDLGYVAFYALGAYAMAVLTSPEMTWHGIHLTFWQALPFAVLASTSAGIILGIPVLGMRGDYLAIVTLGFGEIIRLVFLSDWLKPFLGGSNGITRIPKAVVGSIALDNSPKLYYLILAGCVVAAFVAIRLKDSRLGRAWMAMREDEDVAQAMGIDLIKTKLLAFATGATFSGLSGAIFASKLTSIYPHSFHVLVSINVLGVIIVGGMGSIPGVVVGALALVGLPELLREFAEFRLLMYGAALVFMMLTRPEGLVPEARRKLELHEADGEV